MIRKKINVIVNCKQMIVLCLLGFAFFAGISSVIVKDSWKHGYVQVWDIILAGVFLLIGLVCLYPLLNLKKHVYNNNHPEEYKGEKVKRDRRRILNFLSFLLFIYLLALNYSVIKDQIQPPKIDQDHLKTFKAKLSKDVDYWDASRGSSKLNLYISGKDSLEFHIPNPDYNSYIANEIFHGDSIQITILQDDYEKWISKTKALEFRDLHIGYGAIEVYGIKDDKYIYWDPKEFQKKINEDLAFNFWFALGLDTVLVLVFTFQLFRKPKPIRVKPESKKRPRSNR